MSLHERRVKQILKEEEQSMGRKCTLVDFALIGPPRMAVDLVVYDVAPLEVPGEKVKKSYSRRWTIRTPESRASGFVNTEIR